MAQTFPADFVWGTATASFQIEGATQEDGRGESIWDRFAATPGNILTGETGDPASDSYHRYPDDIRVMRELGVNAYRFSIAWPRVIPDGDGALNPLGLDYYERVVDALLAANIRPFVTLYHWDLPQALQDRGGWGSRATVDAYLRYVEAVVARLGDRVVHWMTFNEPWCISILSHELGVHAPGLRDRKLALQVAHHLLVAHGLAVPLIRSRAPQAQVGIVLNFNPAYPVTASEADQTLTNLYHARFNLWFLDPLTGRGYPQDAWNDYGDAVPTVQPGDLETVAAPLDFLGVNYYSWHLCYDREGSRGYPILRRPNPVNMMARGWQNVPHALVDLITWLHTDYGLPALYITENGATYDDVLWEGRVHDLARLDYLKQHIAILPGLIAQGIPLKGYFCWSLLDNFEWAAGTRDRFGLAYTDFTTQQRILKDSGIWFGRVTRANALVD
jgi:beta-glucosidase